MSKILYILHDTDRHTEYRAGHTFFLGRAIFLVILKKKSKYKTYE